MTQRTNVQRGFNYALLPGGVYIQLHGSPALALRLIDVMQHRAGTVEAQRAVPWELLVKMVHITHSDCVALHKKGTADDHDSLSLGDAGMQYGEARHGFFSQILRRQLGTAWLQQQQTYFRNAIALFEMPLSAVKVTVKLFFSPEISQLHCTVSLAHALVSDATMLTCCPLCVTIYIPLSIVAAYLLFYL